MLDLLQGKAWAVVEGGEGFEIRTPGLVAAVRGTTLRLDVAEGDAPSLLKVFEGTAIGFFGFEATEVEAGFQFSPEGGLEPLVLDELDRFNLERDRLARPPELSLEPLPSQLRGPTLEFTGRATPGVTVRSGPASVVAGDESFQLAVPLRPGFNLLVVTATAADGPVVTRAQPLIRTDPEPFLVVRAEAKQGRLRIVGVTSPNARLSLRAADLPERHAQADDRGASASSSRPTRSPIECSRSR